MPAEENLERIYDAHAQALFAFLLNLTRNEADTRDLLQETFIKLAKRPELLTGIHEERSFLLHLAHNQAIDLIRRRGTREKNCGQLADEMAPSSLLSRKTRSTCSSIHQQTPSRYLQW